MRVLLFAFALILPGFAAAQSGEFPLYAEIVEGGLGAPVPSVNIVLVQNGVELAADTTDAAGFAEFPAGETGEHSVVLQDPAPVEALLLVIAGRQEWSAEVGPELDANLVEIAAEAGEIVQLWLIAFDENYQPAEPGEPADPAPPPAENTHNEADAAAEAGGDAQP